MGLARPSAYPKPAKRKHRGRVPLLWSGWTDVTVLAARTINQRPTRLGTRLDVQDLMGVDALSEAQC